MLKVNGGSVSKMIELNKLDWYVSILGEDLSVTRFRGKKIGLKSHLKNLLSGCSIHINTFKFLNNLTYAQIYTAENYDEKLSNIIEACQYFMEAIEGMINYFSKA